jgi:3-methyl-2-oxobutanoate hydroxymethyltransferase
MNVRRILQAKKNRRRLAMLTAYDAPTAGILHACGVDITLVGDSVGMVLLGYASTRPVTMDEMIHHAKAVRRGAPKAFVIGDMPYEAVRRGPGRALQAAKRFRREARCDAVKVEWRADALEIIERILRARIPVMAHLGLTPQDASKTGGFKVRATAAEEAAKVLRQAKLVERAGVFGVLLECVPKNVAEAVTRALKVPTFGIGAGPSCDGQVLVFQDLVGAFSKFRPKFVKAYGNADAMMRAAVTRYVRDVRSGRFPAERHSFHMTPRERARFRGLIR